jgi:hypothetical protein
MPSMKMFRAALCLALVGFVVPGQVAAQRATPADSAAIVGVVQQFFDAMARRDTAAARASMTPGAVAGSFRTGAPPAPVRFQSDSAFIASLASGKQKLLERMWSSAVRVSGDIADVWTPYDFHVDGKFSHCGIDVFTLFRTPSGWRIATVVYTVQRDGCAPSPLGPVSAAPQAQPHT